MISRKICLLGAVAVGKTSLCRRFVHGVFSDKYHSTIGVKVDKKVVSLPEGELKLIIWDLQGEERYHKVVPAFIKGMSAYFLVVDVSRQETVDVAFKIHARIVEQLGDIPFLLILSKCDLPFEKNLRTSMESLENKAAAVFETSSANDTGILDAFNRIAELVG